MPDQSLSARRAWIEIGRALRQLQFALSLSARRAWIEIDKYNIVHNGQRVALRKESVDRNFYYADKDADWVRSLSARRAWIEIVTRYKPTPAPVSLSARRAWIEIGRTL